LPNVANQFDAPSNRGGASEYEWSDVVRLFINLGVILSIVVVGRLAVFFRVANETSKERGDPVDGSSNTGHDDGGSPPVGEQPGCVRWPRSRPTLTRVPSSRCP
jgi:hypothetical protein